MWPRFDTLPAGLDTMPPGPALASALAAVDVRRLSGYDRVVVLRAQARMRSHYDATMCASMVAVCEATGEELAGVPLLGGEVEEAAAAEIRCALHLTGATAANLLGLAFAMLRRVPAV